jgi:hypothetical protein
MWFRRYPLGNGACYVKKMSLMLCSRRCPHAAK